MRQWKEEYISLFKNKRWLSLCDYFSIATLQLDLLGRVKCVRGSALKKEDIDAKASIKKKWRGTSGWRERYMCLGPYLQQRHRQQQQCTCERMGRNSAYSSMPFRNFKNLNFLQHLRQRGKQEIARNKLEYNHQYHQHQHGIGIVCMKVEPPVLNSIITKDEL